VAQSKELNFSVELDPNLPRTIYTDPRRLYQILKNLLSNAFKFTEQGQVSLRVEAATHGWSFDHATLKRAETVVAFVVKDTGIGIAADKQKVIFEAFQQADGSTSRRYGGTGLGLSISREIAQLLGGEIRLTSEVGQGSAFTLYLPQVYLTTTIPGFDSSQLDEDTPAAPSRDRRTRKSGRRDGEMADRLASSEQALTEPSRAIALLETGAVPDDRDSIQPGDRTLLIIEDDINFARIMLDLARTNGFKGLVALQGDTGLTLAQEFKPDAITLDIQLPVMSGWTVLDRLKHNLHTRHIPVHIISVMEESQRGLRLGALAYLEKPVTPEALGQALLDLQSFIERGARNLLIVEDDETQRQSIMELIGNGDIQTIAVGNGAEALAALKSQRFECMILDLGLPDMSGFDLIEQIKQEAGLQRLPIIVYTGKALTKKEETQLKRLTDTIIIKDVKSPERLLDEVSLFLHRVEANLPPAKRQILQQLYQIDPVLSGKKVLIVDDDVRNIFALTSALERHQMQVLYAENGKDGIEMLQSTPQIDVVLMDVMMPEMDGYETMQAIRKLRKFKSLPIIALTAKAMKGDREKCIEAGASDYIAKPVDTEQLLSLLRVWLYK
jgi:CheY-like chemotaxis protein